MSVLREYKKISDKAVKVIGTKEIRSMSPPQRGLLNNALERLIAKRGSAESISEDEILGQYEQIINFVLPTGSHEHLLDELTR